MGRNRNFKTEKQGCVDFCSPKTYNETKLKFGKMQEEKA